MSDLERAQEWLGEHVDSTGLPWGTAEDLAALLAETRADAIEDAARSIQINNWVDIFKGPLPERLGNAQRAVDWLRERAEEVRR